jgi:G3E family GTPase
VDNNIFELSNGCICCSLNEDFYNVLNKLLEDSHQFDHLLIETTGIADPTAIVKAFFASEITQSKFMIDSVICLADATNLEEVLEDQPEALMQLALSDIVLLNKTESVQSHYVIQLREIIKQINPIASFHPVSYANLSGIDILEVNAYIGREIQNSTYSFLSIKSTPTDKKQ